MLSAACTRQRLCGIPQQLANTACRCKIGTGNGEQLKVAAWLQQVGNKVMLLMPELRLERRGEQQHQASHQHQQPVTRLEASSQVTQIA